MDALEAHLLLQLLLKLPGPCVLDNPQFFFFLRTFHLGLQDFVHSQPRFSNGWFFLMPQLSTEAHEDIPCPLCQSRTLPRPQRHPARAVQPAPPVLQSSHP